MGTFKYGLQSLISEAAVRELSLEQEMLLMQRLCKIKLENARKFLQQYLANAKQLYLSCLNYLLEKSRELFLCALACRRRGWGRLYKNKRYLVKGSLDDELVLQKSLLDEPLRVLFSYSVSANVQLLPEVLAVVKQRAEQEAEAESVSLEELMTRKSVAYATIYNHQMYHLDDALELMRQHND